MYFTNKRNCRFFIVAILYFGSIFSARATTDPVLTSPLHGTKDSIHVNAVSSLADTKYFSLSQIQKQQTVTHKISNLVGVGLEEDSSMFIPGNFSVTITLQIITKDQNDVLIDTTIKPFTINYDTSSNSKYKSFSYYSFTGAARVSVKIISIDSGGITWPVSKVLRIENTITANRDYPFSCTASVPELAVDHDLGNDELLTTWSQDPLNPNPGITEYDLEWAWVDQKAISNYEQGSSYIQNLIFEDNATRVTIKKMTYSIPLLYDDIGWVFVRVRPVQVKDNGQRVEGQWTWINTASALSPQPLSDLQPVFFEYTGHERNLNWQASTSFAEDGKRKSVVQYFDGSLRSRQTVTKDNTTNTTIVAESFYDYQGRAVLQVLPAPTLSNIIGYAHNFNKAINEEAYPKYMYDRLENGASICSSPAKPFETVTGTANYYSPKNLLLSQGKPEDKFIPDATDGINTNVAYAFTETRLSPDGRIASQGGVGINHQIGSNHETKYYYGNAAQEELDALFGTDAGAASHYFKNIVKDANGQYSVSYTDMHGRTVATALAGKTPTNNDGTAMLEALSSQNEVDFTRQLIDKETNRVIGNNIISSKPIIALKDGWYKFRYDLSAKQLSLLNCNNQPVCYDCMYTLKIAVTSDCSMQTVFTTEYKNFTLGEYLNQCNGGEALKGFHLDIPDPQTNPNGLLLAEGSYTVTKTLSLSKDAQTAYSDVYVANDSCKKYHEFYNQEYQALLAGSNCNMTCESCTTAIGIDFSDFVNKYIDQSGRTEPLTDELIVQLQAAYVEAKDNCKELCNKLNPPVDDGMDFIKSIEDMMLQDVTPPYGQYAMPEKSDLNYNIFKVNDPTNRVRSRILPAGMPSLEVFPSNSGLPDYLLPVRHFSENDIYTPTPVFGIYYDELDQPDHTFDLTNSPPTPAQFIAGFQTSWAKELLPHHPEYRKLMVTKQTLKPSYQFEANLTKDITWSQAVSHHYIIDLLNLDPLFLIPTAGPIIKDQLDVKMSKYIQLQNSNSCPEPAVEDAYVSMWQVALATVFCRDKTDPGDPCYPDHSSPDTKAGCLTYMPVAPGNVHGTDPTGSNGSVCETDWDWAWNVFKNLYLSERRKLISTYLNTVAPVFPSAYPNSNIPPYQLRFIDYANPANISANLGNGPIGGILNTLSGNSNDDINSGVNAAQLLVQQQYKATCHAYASTWIAQLQNCPQVTANGPMTQEDKDWLTERLESICRAGSDEGHPLGASSLKNGDQVDYNGNLYTEFPDVIKDFLQNKLNPGINGNSYTSECFPWLITVPVPYGKQPALANSYLLTKPDECQCNVLAKLKYSWEQSGIPVTFPQYMLYNHGTIITQGKLDTLMALCDGTFSCKMLPKAIIIPPALQCRGTEPPPPACISCEDYQGIKTDFKKFLSSDAPFGHPQNDEEISYNNAFANYANYRTGFSKTWLEYVAFQNTCSEITIECEELNQSLVLFKQTPQYLQNPTGLSCMQVFVNYFNARFQVVYTYQQWMAQFQRCGSIPEVCKTVITCESFSSLINDFYDFSGVQVYKNANCQLLFVNYVNGRWFSNYTYDKLADIYKTTCPSGCALDICGFPNHFLLTRVYNAFKAAHNGHVWDLTDCKKDFETFFNNYFGLTVPMSFDQIAKYYKSKGNNKLDCVPDIDDLCNPPYNCTELDHLVEDFYSANIPIENLENCEQKFADWFNTKMQTSYSYSEIAALYLSICKKELTICSTASACSKMIGFVNKFILLHPPKDMTENECQSTFITAFNIKFGTTYTTFEQIRLLYQSCSFNLNVCDKDEHMDRAIDPESLTGFLAAFKKDYPDPATKFKNGECEDLFTSKFNEQFKSTYSFSNIEAYYMAQAKVGLDVCVTRCDVLGQFINSFNTQYSNLILNAAARQDLFTWAYNNAFVVQTGAGLKTDVKLQWTIDDKLELVPTSSDGFDPKAFKPLVNFEDLRKTMQECSINTSSFEPIGTVSIYNSQALLSLKQVYYILHPNGMSKECEKDFAAWFNRVMKTKYEYTEIFNLYNSTCGTNAGYICGVPSENEEKNQVLAILTGEGEGPNIAIAEIMPMLCGLNEPLNEFTPKTPDDPCASLPAIAWNSALEKYTLYTESLHNYFEAAYKSKCMEASNLESFTVTYKNMEYHYTLYYYDQAGNLVKTVPPAGVNRFTSASDLAAVTTARANVLEGQSEVANQKTPLHALYTEYRYNTLNQVIAQKTPDADRSNFFYDRLGRLAVSQNAKQAIATPKLYSYTLYDPLGRITEVGQLEQNTQLLQDISQKEGDETVSGSLSNWLFNKPATEITRTFYDKSYIDGHDDLCPQYLCQQNLRNRVSYTAIYPAGTPGSFNDFTAATFYSYDIHGNVDVLLQDYGSNTAFPNAMNSTGNRFKKLEYDYDLISGKVNAVTYQPDFFDAATNQWIKPADQFWHRYSYDAENRLTDVETSKDNIYWETDARYNYYKHGPLARTILGQLQVQGIDYAYTLQGWLKGVNSTSVGDGSFDIGKDGKIGGDNRNIARDVYGFSLNYFSGDYKAIGNASLNTFTQNTFGIINADANKVANPLFNGNIAAMLVNIPKLGAVQLYGYKYDQLNRIKSMDAFNGFNNSTNNWATTPQPLAAYKERVSYDANGNIQTYERNGDASRTAMDYMHYTYKPNTNQLDKVLDDITDATSNYGNYNDIKRGQTNGNYSYDKIGNLIQDKSEGLYDASNPTKPMVEWNVYGKITKITKIDLANNTASIINYTYDATGNRISKNVGGKITYYVRDATGNVMSTYSKDVDINNGDLSQTEIHLYGSSRLGILNLQNNMQNTPVNTSGINIFTRGNKFFELNNHLGNVLVTVSDKNIQHNAGNGMIDYYTADVVTANDYYPGGMQMPGRKFKQPGSDYRYGFGGQEKSDEIKGEGNSYTAEYWEYDPRLGRRWNVDPIVKMDESPYVSFRNNPIVIVDPLGEDGEPYKVKKGDNLSKIAKKFGTTISALAKLNGIKHLNKIKVGQVLTVGSSPTPAEAQELGGHHQPTDEELEYEKKNQEGIDKAYAISVAVQNWNNNVGPNLAMMTNVVAELNAPYQTGGVWGEVNSGANTNGAGNTAWTGNNLSVSLKSTSPQVGGSFGSLSYNLSESGIISLNNRSVTNGTFDFVVTNDNKLLIGAGHYNLSGEANSVKAVGQIQLFHGQVMNINNSSGHYKPSINQALNYKNILKSAGVNVSRANLNIYDSKGTKIIKIKHK